MEGVLFRCTLVIIGLGLSAANAAAQGRDSLDCVIQPSREVQLSSAVSGILEAIEVDRGDAVTQGQLLARLNSGVERASAELARLAIREGLLDA